jgi:hypothetical protein
MGEQSFNKRVTVPLVAMSAIVLALAGLGFLLSGLGGNTASTSTQNHSSDVSGTQSARPSVIVLNGTNTSGLARQVSEVLAGRGWTINSVGNWSDKSLATSTVFYPAGAQKSALLLAKETAAVAQPAPSTASQTALTYVVMK